MNANGLVGKRGRVGNKALLPSSNRHRVAGRATRFKIRFLLLPSISCGILADGGVRWGGRVLTAVKI